jgi:hypothetical protein
MAVRLRPCVWHVSGFDSRLLPSKVNTVFSQPNLKAKPTMTTYEERRKEALQERDVAYAEVREATANLSLKLKRAVEVEEVLVQIEKEKYKEEE